MTLKNGCLTLFTAPINIELASGDFLCDASLGDSFSGRVPLRNYSFMPNNVALVVILFSFQNICILY